MTPYDANLPRRKSRPLPQRLVDHCRVCFEEQLWLQALALLKSSLVSGTGTDLAAAIPPPAYIALIATLSVHPRLTSQTHDDEKHAAAAEARTYLRHLARLISPESIDFSTAFQFEASSEISLREKRAQARHSKVDPPKVSNINSDISINVRFAQGDSVWSRVDDFWAVVGWAFNCSIHYPARWSVWKQWLDFMISVFEQDLDEERDGNDQVKTAGSVQSLLGHYLYGLGQARNSRRRVLRAILADGSSTSLNEFGEIWKKETKPPAPVKTHDPASWQRKLNLENGDYGDYLDSLSDEDVATSRAQSRSRSRRPSRQASPSRRSSSSDRDFPHEDSCQSEDGSDVGDDIIYEDDDDDDNDETINVRLVSNGEHEVFHRTSLETFGGIESIKIRQRFLAILTRFCKTNQSGFTTLEDILDLFTEFFRPLSVPIFQQFICPIEQYLDLGESYRLGQIMLRPLLEGSSADRACSGLSQQHYIAYAAPFAANSSGFLDNAKVSLVVENMMRLLWASDRLVWSKILQEAVDRGIARRKNKASRDGRRTSGKKGGEQEDALQTLAASASRMQVCLSMVKE